MLIIEQHSQLNDGEKLGQRQNYHQCRDLETLSFSKTVRKTQILLKNKIIKVKVGCQHYLISLTLFLKGLKMYIQENYK